MIEDTIINRQGGYEHVHLHSHYSLLDGFGMPWEYASRAKEINQKFLCITDHGQMGAIPQQIRACEENDIQPVFGIELYVNNLQGMVLKDDMSPEEKAKHRKSYHLLAIAHTNEGYANLVRLSSWGHCQGFYYKPRVTHEQLMKHKEGIIFTSCCYLGEIGQAFDTGGRDAAFEMLEKYIEMFQGQFYLEMMLLDFKKQKPFNEFLVEAAEKYHLPMIISNDTHYSAKEDSKFQRYMLMVRTKNTVKDIESAIAKGEDSDNFFELQDANLWMKSEYEINQKWWSDYKDIIPYEVFDAAKLNTVKICELAKGVKLDRSLKLPHVNNAEEIFKEALAVGFKARGLSGRKYSMRLKEEYELITRKGFVSYFLIQKQIMDEARRACPQIMGWGTGEDAHGPGRGCLTYDSRIQMKNGCTKPIGEVESGDFVRTIDGSLQRVLNKMCYPIENENLVCVRTFYGDSKGVTLTKDHKIYGEKQTRPKNWDNLSESTKKSVKSFIDPIGKVEEIAAGDIEIGDWLFVPTPKVEEIDTRIDLVSLLQDCSLQNGNWLYHNEEFVFNEYNCVYGRRIRKHPRFVNIDSDWGYVLGLFTGDGWTTRRKDKQIEFCFNSDEVVSFQRIKSFFEKLGANIKVKEKDGSKNITRLIVQSAYYRKLFDYLFDDYKFKSNSKHVPDCILNSKKEVVSSYLKGYFDADGHEDKNKIKFDTVSRRLADQIRFLLSRIGLPSSIGYSNRLPDPRVEYKNTKPSFSIICPLDSRIATRDCEKEYVFRRIKDGILVRVRKIEEVTEIKNVYDLEVENNHNYLTSSYLVHNSCCGSLACYCLGITDVDPLKHDLLFSRFLSEARGNSEIKLKFSKLPPELMEK